MSNMVPQGELRFRSRGAPAPVIATAGRQLWLASLGTVAAARDGASGLFASLVAAGTRVEKSRQARSAGTHESVPRGLNALRRRLAAIPEAAGSAVLRAAGVAVPQDVKKLAQQIDRLQAEFDNLAAEA